MGHNPKMITVDFIIQKRDGKFPMTESDFDFINKTPLKGYIVTVNSNETGAKFFVDDEGGLSGYIGYDWRDGIFSRKDNNTPKIFKTKAEANRIIRGIKEWRPTYMYRDNYEIRKI